MLPEMFRFSPHWTRTLSITLALVGFSYWAKVILEDYAPITAGSATKQHTLCAGRYLIDVPLNYKLENYDYRIDGVDITWNFKIRNRAEFDASVADRKTELSAEKNGYDQPSLEAGSEFDLSGMHAVIIPYDRTKPSYWFEGNVKKVYPDDGLSAEAWVWTGTHAILLVGKGLGPGSSQAALIRLITTLKNIEPGTIPAESGFCMEMFDAHIMIAGPPLQSDTYEGVDLQFGLEGHPDVKFRLGFYPNLNDTLAETLEVRTKRIEAEDKPLYALRVSDLRKGWRLTRDMNGFELVQKFREENGSRGSNLDWEWPGRIKDPFAARIVFEGKTGYSRDGPVESSLSDRELLKLWDAMVDSIRVRPTTPVETSRVLPDLPLGALAATGRVCGQSGVWECDEPRAVASQRQRFLRAGDIMPMAVVPGTPRLSDRLRGHAPAPERVATVWKLTGHAEAMTPSACVESLLQDAASLAPANLEGRSEDSAS